MTQQMLEAQKVRKGAFLSTKSYLMFYHKLKVQVPTPSADLIGRLFDFYLGPQQEDDDDEEGGQGGQRFIM